MKNSRFVPAALVVALIGNTMFPNLAFGGNEGDLTNVVIGASERKIQAVLDQLERISTRVEDDARFKDLRAYISVEVAGIKAHVSEVCGGGVAGVCKTTSDIKAAVARIGAAERKIKALQADLERQGLLIVELRSDLTKLNDELNTFKVDIQNQVNELKARVDAIDVWKTGVDGWMLSADEMMADHGRRLSIGENSMIGFVVGCHLFTGGGGLGDSAREIQREAPDYKGTRAGLTCAGGLTYQFQRFGLRAMAGVTWDGRNDGLGVHLNGVVHGLVGPKKALALGGIVLFDDLAVNEDGGFYQALDRRLGGGLHAQYFFRVTDGNNIQISIEANLAAMRNWLSVSLGTVDQWEPHFSVGVNGVFGTSREY